VSRGGVILFVCTGNFCRSPMAEALLKQLLRQDGKEGSYEVRSAGTWTREGLSPSPLALQATQDLGLDISAHRSHHLTAEDIEAAKLIIVMTQDHKEALWAEFPQARTKLYLLSEMAGERHDIHDPSGSGSLQLHRRCAEDIKELLEKGYSRMLKLASADPQET
jgi:protein-tyrosine-phosphatase